MPIVECGILQIRNTHLWGQALIICYRHGRAEVQCAYASKLASWKASRISGVRRYEGTGANAEHPKGARMRNEASCPVMCSRCSPKPLGTRAMQAIKTRRLCAKGDPRPQDLRMRTPRGVTTVTVPRSGSNPFPSRTRLRRSTSGSIPSSSGRRSNTPPCVPGG